MQRRRAIVDGNEACASIAYQLSEVIAIYPITPASPMGELADAWASSGRPNAWGAVPTVVEMQSEGGAAGALHGAVTAGGLGTTFTASQGLLLMLPNMYKVAGELTPAVIHVAARSVATHALSIFGDHSDVMAARQTGWAMLAASSPQEAHDFAAVAHAATLASRVPFLHFFDGFRTSHEMNSVTLLDRADLTAMIDPADVDAQRQRALTPERPVLRGTAQNPDVFFQAREACNTFYSAVPYVVADAFAKLEHRTGRRYGLVDYVGHPGADRVIVVMGSGAGAVTETINELVADGARVGAVIVRLYRPFPSDALIGALPATVERIAVLDRTKEPGAAGEPLYQDVLTTLAESATNGRRGQLPVVVGGRYGLSSKEFTPQMVKGILDELGADTPKNHFTVGIVDDVTHTHLVPDPGMRLERQPGDLAAVFYGLGSDGTVGANKNTAKIVSELTDRHVQAYFVYDSKKSGAQTVSHLRFSDRPIRSTYLVDEADLVACHQFGFLDRHEVLDRLRPGGTFLLNAPFGPDEVWDRLPYEVQAELVAKDARLFVIDAHAIARRAGLGGRINTVMQAAFFSLAQVIPVEAALDAIGAAVRSTYAKRGPEVVERNLAVLDATLGQLHRVRVPAEATATHRRSRPAQFGAPDFVDRVTARIMAGEGDLLPVSALPVDGTFPTGTAKWEKRSIALDLPIWDPDLCIDCGKCTIVCPHAAIQMKVFDPDALNGELDAIRHKPFRDRSLEGHELVIQVAPDDCTGCTLCVVACPAASKEEVGRKALMMAPADEHREVERAAFEVFEGLPYLDRDALRVDTIKGSQIRPPLFEFSGACAGCGETPYLKLLTQLFGDHIVVANATGCSSIYGGNLPTTPWTTDADGHGPAWSNSLFEDNAEFGLGIAIAAEQRTNQARELVRRLAEDIGAELATAVLAGMGDRDRIDDQRRRVAELRTRLAELDGPQPAALLALADALVPHDVWIVGGDGWAYDIGYGGLDHVLASGRDVNVLVLDTEVYSNTGGQASKATPRGAVAKFAAQGKSTPKKDLGLLAMQYGNVYVAQIALGSNETQTIRALKEAAEWPGPSLILAYSTCIAHGVDMTRSMTQMDLAVKSGYWPLYRFHPGEGEHEQPFHLDSKAPTIPLKAFTSNEGRYVMLARSDPERAGDLLEQAQADIDERWRYYEQLAGVERTITLAEQDDDHDDESAADATEVTS